jgi:colanic acid/amylovoran biosynthesis glycosyltransferase
MNALETLRALRRPIAFSIDSGTQVISGVTTWMQALVLRLHADGVPVRVLLHHIGPHPERSSIGMPLRAAGVPVDLIPRGVDMPADVLATLAFLAERRPAVFLPQCLHSMYFAAASAGHQGLPWVLAMHSDDPDYWALAEALRPEAVNGRVVAVSQQLAAEVQARGLAQVPMMIPYGVPVGERTATWSEAPFRVAYSGRMVEEQKRLALVMDVLVEACRRDARIEAVLLGDGPARQRAQQRVDEAGLQDRIRFTGRLSSEAVCGELRRCQALLLMSDYEGLPVALLEGMAQGVVPVVRAIPSGIPELVSDGGTGLLVGEDVEGAVVAIRRLADDRELWERCSQGAFARVAQGYNAESSYAGWVRLLAELVQLRPEGVPLTLPRTLELPPHDPRLGRGYPKPAPPPPPPPTLLQRIRRAVARRLPGRS